ncbi:lysM and putative peptidoglycan-binding domain-containing protein 4 [Eurosta solidaginis]|uniref:lysM and putative peptidoglycan-binding domain-containing protein 4 n=1 Tax=Eurosta solidaginis TaxID=178769 RepID=UPI0035314788
MRRQRKGFQSEVFDIDEQSASMSNMALNRESNNGDDFLQMERLSGFSGSANRFENTIEAKVEGGESLQALALRFHCTVADIKRLNKIDKDNEMYARKVIKIPVTPHSILLETLPIVHKSGSNSPEQREASIVRNPLEDAKVVLGEKLIVASVNSSDRRTDEQPNINKAILSSKLLKKENAYTDRESDTNDSTALLDDILNDDFAETQARPIRGPSSLNAWHWSGSDGDMTWVCLFVVILALCFAIPLIIVIFWTHPHTATSSGSSNSGSNTPMAN